MIIKANRHGNGAKLAAYLMDGGKHGERVHSPELHGFEEADNIFDAFRDIELLAGATKAEYPFLHVQVRLPDEDHLSRDQWEQTADRIQARLGLTGQPRADVYHIDEKSGKMHLHIAISLIDEETLKAKPLPYFKLRMKALARELEAEFRITPVKNHRDGPIKYGATKAEEQQAQRLGFDKEAVRNTIRHCWDASDCGRNFDAALAEAGLILAKGDRGHGNYLVIDPKGGLHVLGKRILDASAAQVRQRLSDLNRENIPTVEQARTFMLDLPNDRVEKLSRELAEVQKQREAAEQYAQRDSAREEIAWQDALAKAAIEKEKVERKFVEGPAPAEAARGTETRAGGRRREEWPINPPQPQHQSPGIFAKAAQEVRRDARTEELHGPAAKVWEAWRQSDLDKVIAAALKGESISFKPPSREAFTAALGKNGISFARTTKEESDRSHRQAAYARELGNYAPRFKQGEIVLITEPGPEYRRDGQTTTPRRVHKIDQSLAEKFVKALDIGDRLQGIDASLKASDRRAQQRAADWEAIHEVYADSTEHRRRAIVAEKSIRGAVATTRDAVRTSGAVLGKAVGVASSLGKTLDVIGGIVESLAAPPVTPERKHAADKAKYVREAEAEDRIEFSRYGAVDAQQRQNRQNEQTSRDREREHERGR